MPENNRHKSECSFSAEAISYLYDEIGEREKIAFEAHLSNCSHCADELADLSFSRSFVKDWRDLEFAHLETPAIQIPFQSAANDVSTANTSLLARFRQIFSIYPAWTTAAAVASVLLVFGIFFAASNILRPVEITENNVENSTKDKVLSSEQIPQKKNPEELSAGNEQNEDSIKSPESLPNNTIKQAQNEYKTAQTSNADSEISVVKAAEKSPKVKPEKRSVAAVEKKAENASKNINNPVQANRRAAPTLNGFEEDEDNTLRLADLFEEIEARK